MTTFRLFCLPALAAAAVLTAATPFSAPADAGSYHGPAGRTAVWVYIRKAPDEDIWEACRRVYRRDVYQVRGAGPRRARCFVDASEVGNPQGYNTTRELDRWED